MPVYTEPAKLPEWASANPYDPAPGTYAIVEPEEAKKDSGFAHQERPTRQDFNWFFNLVYLWVLWFKQQTDAIWSNLSAVITGAGGTVDMIATPGNLVTSLGNRYNRWAVEGLEMTCGGTDFLFLTGRCLSDDGVFMIDLTRQATVPSGGYAKLLASGLYQKGTGGRGLAAGAVGTAGTLLYIFAVYFSDTTQADIMFDDEIAGGNVAAMTGVAYKRRIGFVYVGGVDYNAMAVSQCGNRFSTMEVGGLPGGLLGSLAATYQASSLNGVISTRLPATIKKLVGIFSIYADFTGSTDTDVIASFSHDGASHPFLANSFGHVRKESGVVYSYGVTDLPIHFDAQKFIKVRAINVVTDGQIDFYVHIQGWIDERIPYHDA